MTRKQKSILRGIAMATMTLEEIMAIPDEEIRKEEESVKKIPCEHDPDCPKRTMEQLKAMGWHRGNPRKKRRENSRPIRTAYFLGQMIFEKKRALKARKLPSCIV